MAKKNGIVFNARQNPYKGTKILADEIDSVNVAVKQPLLTANKTEIVITITVNKSSLVSQFETDDLGDNQIFVETVAGNLKLISDIQAIRFDSLSPDGKFGNLDINLTIRGGGGKVGGPGFAKKKK